MVRLVEPHRIPGLAILTAAPLGLTVLVVASLLSDSCCNIPLSAWLAFTFYTAMGGLIVQRQPGNTVGWLLATMGLLGLVGNAADLTGDVAIVGDLALWVTAWYFFAFLGIFVLLIHVFPTGRPLTGWFRWAYRAAVTGSALLVVRYMVGPPDEGENPLHIEALDAVLPAVESVIVPLLLVGLLSGIASLGLRFHRARGTERMQMKWMFWGTTVAALLLTGGSAAVDAMPEGFAWLGSVVEASTFVLPGLAIVIAITRHRLFDIDRIVSRTVSYALVGAVVALVYSIPALVLPEVLGLSTDLTVAAATLAAAAIFDPVRRRTQRLVDRRFNRSRYDAAREVDAFADRVREGADLGQVTVDLQAVLGRTLGPGAVSMWIHAESP